MAVSASTLESVKDLNLDAASPRLQFSAIISDADYTHDLQIKNGNVTITTITNVTSGATLAGYYTGVLILTTAQRNAILSAMPYKPEMTVTYTLVTKESGVTVGSDTLTGVAYVTAENSSPTIGSVALTDVNATTVAVTSDNTVLIQNQSSIQVVCSNVVFTQGASAARYSVTIGDKEVVGSTSTIAFGTANSSGELTAIITVEDSRGFVGTITQSIVILPYQTVQINEWSIGRVNNVEATIALSFRGSRSSLIVNQREVNSTTTVKYQTKLSSASSYGSLTTLTGVVDGRTTFTYSGTPLSLSEDYSYYIKIIVSDVLTSSELELLVDKGRPLVSFRSDKVGIYTNTPQRTLDVDGKVGMNGYNVMGVITDEIDDNVDLNDVTEQGIYFKHTTMGTTANNYPIAAYGLLEVFSTGGSLVFQRFTVRSTTAPRVYTRVKVNSTWGSWV